MPMDEETRATIESLIETRATIESLISDPTTRWRRATIIESRTTRSPWTAPTRTEAPTIAQFCFHASERYMDISQETAVLSVDTASASIVLKAPLNDLVINKINESVPVLMREWIENTKSWRFAPGALPILKPILKHHYKDIQMLGVPKALPSTKFDQLMAKLDKDDLASIYRILAHKYHPDRGGSHEVMTLVNLVFKGK